MDSVGIGELPDAAAYGDEGSNTLGNISAHVRLQLPTLSALGLTRLVALRDQPAPPAAPMAAYGRMREASPGKDSVTGHWELMGLVLDRPFPTFPNGFPPDVIEAFEARIGRQTMANVVGSGTESWSASAPSTCGPAARSSTPRPTACSRSWRTST